MASSMKSIAFVVSDPMTAQVFLAAHIKSLRQHYVVTVFANFKGFPVELGAEADQVIDAPIVRNISLLEDLKALVFLYKAFRKESFDSVHTVTPKAGLLGMLAARLCSVPNRIHTFTGQVWATKKGVARAILKALDCLIFRLATKVLADSPSQKAFLVSQGVVSCPKCVVLGEGSISGVDTARFKRDYSQRARLRVEWGVGEADLVLLFLGRLCRDKGVHELLSAFERLRRQCSNVHLVLVGPDEEGVLDHVGSILTEGSVHVIGRTSRPEDYYSASDVFVLPSYREGFGTSVIEAAASGIPTVASDIYGLRDAVVDGVTGVLHPSQSVDGLYAGLERLISNPALREKMGISAKNRVLDVFEEQFVVGELTNYYRVSV